MRARGRLPPKASVLGVWVNEQREGRKAAAEGKVRKAVRGMTAERAAALKAVPGWSWAPRAAT